MATETGFETPTKIKSKRSIPTVYSIENYKQKIKLQIDSYIKRKKFGTNIISETCYMNFNNSDLGRMIRLLEMQNEYFINFSNSKGQKYKVLRCIEGRKSEHDAFNMKPHSLGSHTHPNKNKDFNPPSWYDISSFVQMVHQAVKNNYRNIIISHVVFSVKGFIYVLNINDIFYMQNDLSFDYDWSDIVQEIDKLITHNGLSFNEYKDLWYKLGITISRMKLEPCKIKFEVTNFLNTRGHSKEKTLQYKYKMLKNEKRTFEEILNDEVCLK
jgi:hypothetical protein